MTGKCPDFSLLVGAKQVLEIVPFDQPCPITTLTTALCIYAVSIVHAHAQFKGRWVTNYYGYGYDSLLWKRHAVCMGYVH